MKDLSSYLIDTKKKNDGVPFDLGPATIYITKLGTDSAQAEMIKAKQRIFGSGKLGDQAFENNNDSKKTKAMMQFVVASVVKGWENFIVRGEEILYSPEKCLELMQTEEYEPIYDFIIDCASQDSSFKQEELVEDKEDLGNSSSGTE